ncbi:hypothetical protein [Methylocaldum sp.]|uniref:hypothetical protein n=1 Tax=Methylocaldum sp. TaxID=1969727 RepID=UPI002D67C26B|nr:hypothetical protein [Methylocaldum sp.]HYE37075.1 hypothetical protein [Methylocaldum sp.]
MKIGDTNDATETGNAEQFLHGVPSLKDGGGIIGAQNLFKLCKTISETGFSRCKTYYEVN